MKLFLFLLFCLATPFALGADPSPLTIPAQDQSVFFLQWMFGQVGDVLTGREDNIFRQVLIYFNNGVLILGGIVILYSLMVSTINTAGQGEFLGQKWNSVWIPLRAAGGFALMLPVMKGYAVIQVFVMWVVLQGVAVADSIWSMALDKIVTGEIAIPSSTSMGVYGAAQNIFLSEICVRGTERYTREPPLVEGSPRTTGQKSFGLQNTTPRDICGYVKYNMSNAPGGTGTESATAAAENDAIDVLISSVVGIADAYYERSARPLTYADQVLVQKKLQLAAESYSATIDALYRSESSNEVIPEYTDLVNAAKSSGWIYAGSYFMTLSQISNQYVNQAVSGPVVGRYQEMPLEELLDEDHYTDLKGLLADAEALATPEALKMGTPSWSSMLSVGWNSGFNLIQNAFINLMKGMQSILVGSDNTNPMLQLQTFGMWTAGTATAAYGIFAGAMTLAALVGYVASWLNPAGFALSTLLNFIITPLIILTGVLFSQGLLLAYYVPMIPYLIFTLGAIGWLILVIEAMVAAPLIALGILHPEGQHEVFGHGNAGVMILAGIFLRPALMIVGLFGAFLLSYAVVAMISIGFMPAALLTLGPAPNPVGLVVLMTMYVMLILVGLNKSFALIHILPDRIMRWIGQPGEQGGDVAQDLQGLRGGAQEAGAKASGAATKSGERYAGIGQQQHAKRQAEQDRKEKEEKKRIRGY